jgi:hypothetical protein
MFGRTGMKRLYMQSNSHVFTGTKNLKIFSAGEAILLQAAQRASFFKIIFFFSSTTSCRMQAAQKR